MIRYAVQRSAVVAQSYFREHFRVGDYYAEEAYVRGEWFGEGAAALGLKAGVSEQAFGRLCEGLHPYTGERLGARLNSTRVEQGRACPNRRVLYDFTFSPTKSVSVAALCFDAKIVGAHDEAVRIALAELEKFAHTRVRKDGADAERQTGQIVAALFRHETSREGDPHLHTHAAVMNATFDSVEQRWKALSPDQMLKAQRFADACYQHELAKRLVRMGYAVRTENGYVELPHISQETRERFSKRHQQIDAEEKRLEAAGKVAADRLELRARIARDSRKRKVRGLGAEKLREKWHSEMTTKEREHMRVVADELRKCPRPEVRAKGAVEAAELHLFERNAVVTERDLLTAALLHRIGNELSIDELRQEIGRRNYVRDRGDPTVLSLPEQSKIEAELVEVVKRSIGQREALNPAHVFSERPMSAEQRNAVTHLLRSKDGVMSLRGGAGTGKSHTLSELVKGLKAAKHPIVVVAPQNQQVRGLKEDGLEAQTLSRLLASRKLEWGSVVIVDEAGQVSARQMVQLTRLALMKGARLILSGDTRQHGAVEATDALQLLETYAGVTSVQLREIRRQDPSRGTTDEERNSIAKYREAVQAAADQKHDESFDLLCEAGRVHEVQGESRMNLVTAAFKAALDRKETTLVVAQTWDEVNRLNTALQSAQVARGKVTDVRNVVCYQNLNATEGHKLDSSTYGNGREIVFVRDYGRFNKGDLAEVTGVTGQSLKVKTAGKETTLGKAKVDRFIVVRRKELKIGVGDQLQLRMNGKSVEGHSLANGELVTVHRHGKAGELVVRDDRGRLKTLTAEQRVFNLGYAVTSYGSQGKTVDTVLFSDSGRMGATNRKQWYVTISRGRKNVYVLTEDVSALRKAILRSGDREFAVQPVPRAPAKLTPKPAQQEEEIPIRKVAAKAMRQVAWQTAQARRVAQTQSFGTRQGM